MSYLVNQDIPCTYCLFPNSVEVWSIVNVKEDPDLRDLILGGEINMMECRSCQKMFYAESFLLYHDPDAELLAFVYPTSARNRRMECEEKTRRDFEESLKNQTFPRSLNYSPLTLFGMDELVRILEEEDEIAMQGEILSALAKQSGMVLKKLRPSVARRQKLPSILPSIGDDLPVGESVVKALCKIEDLNDRLTVYSQTIKRLQNELKKEIQFD